MTFSPEGNHPLRSICQAWTGKLNRAIEQRKPWLEIAEECEMFFSAATDFLWDPSYRHKFWNVDHGAVQPRFQITIQRAFELVALFGPTLYWRNPIRTAHPRAFPEIPQAILEQLQAVPETTAYYQAIAEYQREGPARVLCAELMQRVLNWTPEVLDLHSHGELAITQGLVTGRGCLWTMPYQPPGSDRVMVGSFWDAVEHLLIDPDAETLEGAWWIAQQVTEPVWKTERDRAHLGYRPGSLHPYATIESGNRQGELKTDGLVNYHRQSGQTQDLIVYWRIWSRCGLARLAGLQSELKTRIDQVCGDYVYLEICNECPYPLNMPTDRLVEATSDEVRKAFRWPIPYWKLDRWPVSALDFYRRPKKPWPIPPLGPGLGELKALNVLFAALVSKVWTTMRDFVVIAKQASDEVRAIIEKGRDLSFIPLEATNNSIKELVEFLQHPPVNKDVYTIIEMLLNMFDRRVGLTELLYGLQGSPQSRSATDVKIREEHVSVRPEYMASKVAAWMSQVAKAEAMATRWYMTGSDVAMPLGRAGAMLWDRYIVQSPVERTLFEIDYSVEAASGRRPNRDRDTQNINEFMKTFGPIVASWSAQTANPQPINEMIRGWGKCTDMDVSGIVLPPPPQPPPGQQEAMAQQAAAQQQEAALKQQEAQQKVAGEQANMAMAGAKHQQEMAQSEQRFQVETAQRLRAGLLDELLAQAKLRRAMNQPEGRGRRR